MAFQPMRLAIVLVTETRRGLLPRVFTLAAYIPMQWFLFCGACCHPFVSVEVPSR